LSRTLRELRDNAGFSQAQAAQQAGVSQALIARFETGRQVPRPDQVVKLCDVYGVHDQRRLDAIAMATDARGRTERVVLHRDVVPAQARINRIAETATLERTFSPIGIPGLLQTHSYAHVLFHAEPNLTPQAAERGAAERISGQNILDEVDHEFGFLIPEGALGWCLPTPLEMAEQIEHLVSMTGRSNIQIGLIPWGLPTPLLPLTGFTIFDDRLVLVGTTARVAYITSRADIDAYTTLYARIEAHAVYGQEAEHILISARDRYRSRLK